LYGAESALSPGSDDWAGGPRGGGGTGVDDDARDDDDDGEDDDGDDDDDADGASSCSADSHCNCEEGAAARRGVINCTPLGRCKLHAVTGIGACECRRGFAGDECSVCARGFVGFPPKCAPAKACARECGRGTCDLATGECRCPAQFGGPQCAECAAGFGGPSCVPTARVTDLGWQPTKGDIQRTDSGWQPIGAAARHVTMSSLLPQPSSSGRLLLLLLPVLLLIAVVARWPRSASHLIQYVTGEARRANPRDDYVNIPLSPLHRQMLHHSAMRAPAIDADCGTGDPLLERMPSRTPSRRVGRVA